MASSSRHARTARDIARDVTITSSRTAACSICREFRDANDMGKIAFSRQEIAALHWRTQAIQEVSLLAFARKRMLAVHCDTVKLARKNAGLPFASDGKRMTRMSDVAGPRHRARLRLVCAETRLR